MPETHGRIIDALTGQYIDSVEIVALAESNIESEQRYLRVKTKTKKDGSFVINGLRNKTYTISFSKNNYYNQVYSSRVPNESNLLIKEPIAMYPLPTNMFEVSGLVIKDKITGLMWARDIKATGPGFHTSPSDKARPEDFINKVNLAGLAGFTDWRIPSNEDFGKLCYTARGYVNTVKNNASRFGFENDQRFANVYNFMKVVGFTNMDNDANSYVSSTNYEDKVHAEWLTFYDGGCSIDTNGRSYLYTWLYVWPVRNTKADSPSK